jgi:hypothetical protein
MCAILAPRRRKRLRLAAYDYAQPGAYFVTVWQRGFYDHVVRSERDLADIRATIQGNPARWASDSYFESA